MAQKGGDTRISLEAFYCSSHCCHPGAEGQFSTPDVVVNRGADGYRAGWQKHTKNSATNQSGWFKPLAQSVVLAGRILQIVVLVWREKLTTAHCAGRVLVSQKVISRKHQIVHAEEKLFHCLQCGKSFSLNGYLRKHQRLHTEEKPHHCSQCGKSFLQENKLKRHQLVHTEVKPYRCSECGKSFAEKHKCDAHQRIHSGKNLYYCLECGKSFNYQANLQRHQRIHSGEKLYQCYECGMSFTQSNQHQYVHTGEKPFHCSQCG
ncbi:gastrula zinc finger protein XlCGF7.1-like [Hemibagrus wyckioides]|uniref:gastrula zinc finger protein XlCGF7.1-like n=1 Tax=Hemibagrus wyckioides TaxID=337641 RepID=UPI00266BD4A6|nr:gastrula zinc finger protein XlCGF7.1-like [Hemibagrus wyckioides]